MSKPWEEMTALELGRGIGAGDVDPVDLAEHFLDRIARLDPEHEVYVRTTPERALAEAQAARGRARAGLKLGPLDGVPLSWKDLFDSAGTATSGGTPLLGHRVPSRDAEVLGRASRAGMVCLGKTNLPEFAYSGIGINPHTGTPANPFDAENRRAPGGSSSGAAVSVARGLAPAAIGSDTGGSVRVPAAWCGLTGLKTTAGVLPTRGVLALSPSLDTVGPLTRDVADANAIFATLAARPMADLEGAGLERAHLLVPTTVMWEDLDETVAAALDSALERLSRAGATLVRAEVPELSDCVELVNRHGNIISSEGYALWRDLLEANPEQVEATILARFRQANDHSSADIEAVHLGLAAIQERYRARTAAYSALVAPTVPIPPPPIARLVRDEAYHTDRYMRCVRNTRIANQLGLCALTLPCGTGGGLPVGLMLMAPARGEGALLRLGLAVERALGS